MDKGAHREVPEMLCFVRNEKAIRSRARPRVKTVSEAYQSGKLRAEFIGTDMEDKLMRRQRQMALDAILGLGENGYHIPPNVEMFNEAGYVWNQVANQKPWAVYVLVDGKRKRRRCNNLYEAVLYHRTIHKTHPSSGIVSMGRAYDIPSSLRFKKAKLPKRFKWCPYCGTFRVYIRVLPEQRFFTQIKRWDEKKKQFIWVDRKLWLTECQLCGNTNRDSIFRRSNQPWELRKIKKGVKRIKPRVLTERGQLARQKKRRRVRR